MLSGGFDSGTVSILAAELLGKARLTTFSHIPQFPDKLPPPTKNVFFDETPYIDANASAMPNIHSVKLTSRSISPLKGIEKFIDAFDNIIHGASNAYWFIDLYENVSHQGFGVLLSGENGNAGMSYKGIADLLPFYHPYYLSSPQLFLKKKLVSPLLNKFLTQRRHTKSINFQINDGVVNEDALKESGIYEDIENNPDMYSVSLNNHQHHMLKLIDLCRRYRLIGEISNYYGFSYRDPTADIRLLEFCLSVPNEIHFNSRGQNKALIRKVMQGRLPQMVLRETKTGKQSADIYFRIQQDLPQMEEWISVLSKNQRFVHLIDINKLKTLFVLIKNGKLTDTLSINRLLKAMMSGIFLEKRGFN
ncbi:hypothetical protein GCM10027442_22260 [Emticicia fontis]